MNYEECINWLYSFEKIGIKLGLERITHICEGLGNPQRDYKIIHVGGTNGKGSVCRFLESILVSSGYNVGTYTSPHLQRFSERFVVNKNEIIEIELVSLVDKLKPIVEEMINKNNIPTFFEITTAMVFQYFKEKKVDYAIIEVGLGGRFDATNIVTPILTIITNVSFEHQFILGDNIKKISYEKAGIIKKEVPVITAATKEALDTIKKIAKEKNAPITIIKSDFWKKENGGLDWQEFKIMGSMKDYLVNISFPGSFQGENITIALYAMEALQMKGIYVTDDAIHDGIEKTNNPGRMDIISIKPTIILDGAHNVAGITKLRDTIKKDFKYDKLILIFGVLSDKDIIEMLKIIVPISDMILLWNSENNRFYDPFKLRDMILNLGFKGRINYIVNKKNIIKHVKEIAKKNDIILIAGSLYLVGEAKYYFEKNVQKH
jgi:dihydrofolate synthase/folylpolyglutamate synthase